MWLFESYEEFSLAAAGDAEAKNKKMEVAPGRETRLSPTNGKGPPVIVAALGEISSPYPMLEGRHRQTLPGVPGRLQGRLLKINNGFENPRDNGIKAWLVPWRVGVDRTMVITVKPGTILVLNVESWPGLNDPHVIGYEPNPRQKTLRRAANVLSAAPSAFATAPSIRTAYARLEDIWNDESLAEGDPQGDLLASHARRLRSILEDLGTRPRAILRSEHRMLKLQSVRRTDAKTLRWLSAQPGRNTAERAGSRQRIKAPKRYETVATLENQVLRAFAALTVRETRNWLLKAAPGVPTSALKPIIEAHQLRARRIETILQQRRVPEATPPVQPNFPLRFDSRYREIWRAWSELRARSNAAELEWMWQNRTYIELLGLRAAMKLHQEAYARCGGTLAHAPILRSPHAPDQGCYLNDDGITCTFGSVEDGEINEIKYCTGNDSGPLGAVATVNNGATLWWNVNGLAASEEGSVGELPWFPAHGWDARLDAWAAKAMP